MPLQEGETLSFEFYDWNNNLRTAQTQTVSSGVFNTSDPQWIISGVGNSDTLQYINPNGEKYEARIHCRVMDNVGPRIRTWAETWHNGRTEGDVKGILITDNAGAPGWTVEFMQIVGQDHQVSFRLHHSILDGY